MNPITDRQLHRYFDDDLSPEEAAELDAQLAASPEEAAKLEALGEVRELLVQRIVGEARGLDSDALFADIEAGIAADASSSARPVARVIPFRRKAIPIVVGGVLAAAAAVALVIRSGESGDDVARARSERQPTAIAHGGSEVEDVKFGENSIGTVFEVSSDSGETYAVIWISDE